MPWPQTGATQYHAQLGLPDKGRAIKGLLVCNNWDLKPLDLLNGLALLDCYQPCPKVLFSLFYNLCNIFSFVPYKIDKKIHIVANFGGSDTKISQGINYSIPKIV